MMRFSSSPQVRLHTHDARPLARFISHPHLVTSSSALRIRPGHLPAKKKLQQARDALDAKAAAMRAQIDAAIEKAQEQQMVEKEKEKVKCDV